jgi:cobalt-zinc-cadmium efflux system outer membrane protein
MIRICTVALLLGVLFGGSACTQTDTVRLSLAEAEQHFLAHNLQILAARLNVDATRGAAVQAALWSNPNISIEQNAYNQFTQRWFDTGPEGNTGVQIQQLILLAGKRGKAIQLADMNTRLAEQTLYDILRALKLELRTDFYDLHYLRQSTAFYDESIADLTKAVDHLESVYDRRAVLLSEVLRVKELLFSLQNERLGLLTRIATAEGDLRVLLHDSSASVTAYIPVLDTTALNALRPTSITTEKAIAEALLHRPDIHKADAAVGAEEANLSYQKALAFPDLTVGALWSRAGGYVPNYVGVTLAIDLPLFNRNQGNIEISERTLEANRALEDGVRENVQRDVTIAMQRAVEIDRLFHASDRSSLEKYHELVEGMFTNYQKRNISVLEFTDFLEAYRTSMVLVNQLENDRADAIEALNFATGTDLLKP